MKVHQLVHRVDTPISIDRITMTLCWLDMPLPERYFESDTEIAFGEALLCLLIEEIRINTKASVGLVSTVISKYGKTIVGIGNRFYDTYVAGDPWTPEPAILGVADRKYISGPPESNIWWDMSSNRRLDTPPMAVFMGTSYNLVPLMFRLLPTSV